MKGLWIATIVLWGLGVLALPMLIGGPALFQTLGAKPELRPFVIFLGGLFCVSVLWLIATIAIAFKHHGRARTLALAAPAGMTAIFLTLNWVAPKTTSTITVDLPPAFSSSR